MAKQIFINNFQSQFAAPVKSTPTTGDPDNELDYGILRISSGAAVFLSQLTDEDWYTLTGFKKSGSVESNIEILKVKSVDSSVVNELRLYVMRGQEGTQPQSYVAGDYIGMRATAGGFANFTQKAQTDEGLDSKVDKVAGKGLSTEDYSTTEKEKLAGTAAGATANSTDAYLLARANHTGAQEISSVTGLQAGLDGKVDKVAGKGLSTQDYTTAEKSKLAAVATGATANATDAQLRDRATHTGEQPISSVTGLQAALDSAVGDVEFSDIKNKPPKIEDHGITGGTFSGVVNHQAAIKFGSTTAASARDLSKHIDLFGGAYGFTVAEGGTNYVAPTYAQHQFWSDALQAFIVGATGAVRAHRGILSAGGGSAGASRTGRGFHCSTDTAFYGGPFDDHNCFSIFPYMGAGWGSGEMRVSIASGAGESYTGSALIVSEAGITHKGNVTAYSDAKLKENVETLTNALAKVNAMRGVSYTLIADPTKRKQIGVIAQEVQKIFPELVSSVKENTESDEETLVVAYPNMVSILIEAVKELTARVEELEKGKLYGNA